jgi:hypothetical protein
MSLAGPVMVCVHCGAHLAHDHDDSLCSPCRRAAIEKAAHREALVARNRTQIEQTFNQAGLYGVAGFLQTTPEEALDVLIRARIVPFASERRRKVLEHIVASNHRSHVALADELRISRWTVAAYRRQLGIERGGVPMRPGQ